jgi:hypothetical protein
MFFVNNRTSLRIVCLPVRQNVISVQLRLLDQDQAKDSCILRAWNMAQCLKKSWPTLLVELFGADIFSRVLLGPSPTIHIYKKEHYTWNISAIILKKWDGG